MNGFSAQLFWGLLSCGLLLLGAEVFVPGGILGLIGALALIGAVLAAFSAFGSSVGLLVALAIILLAGLSIALWIVFFPRTPVGRKLTLSKDGRAFRLEPEGQASLVGARGTALSDLRPAGMAEIDGRRRDVLAEGTWIERGAPLKVVNNRGNRLVVHRAPPEEPGAGESEATA